MKESLQTLCELFIEYRGTIKSVFKMDSEYLYPACADIFLAMGRAPEEELLSDCRRMVKNSVGIFSDFRGNVLMPLVCMLAASDDPQTKWERTQDNFAVLKEEFWSSGYLALAALLLTDTTQSEQVPKTAARAKAIYRRMKQEHPFLTGQEDSVFAVMLARSVRSDGQLIADMEECYRLLDARFPKSDGLQSASHLFALTDRAPKEKVERMLALYDAVSERCGKYGKYYELSTLAALSLEQAPVEELADDVADVDAFLAEQKGYRSIFGLDRKTRTMHAALLAATNRSAAAMRDMRNAPPETDLAMAAAQQTALAMLAAQQAAMCAMIAASSASSAAAAGSSH